MSQNRNKITRLILAKEFILKAYFQIPNLELHLIFSS